ncbi:MAG: 4Fe-4S binding protein, partial [Promethearchaeota archaeon]
LQSANSAWTAGAGFIEYFFHGLTKGQFPWFFIALIGLFGLFTGRIFCGWVCPTGFIQDLLSGLSSEKKQMSISSDKSWKNFKIVMLVFMIILIAPLGFLLNSNPDSYLKYKDALGSLATNEPWPFSFSNFLFVTLPDIIQGIVNSLSIGSIFSNYDTLQIVFFFVYIIVLGVSVFYPRFYCKALCPYGAAISLFSQYSMLKLQRLPTRCPGRKECGLCEKACPIQIKILDEPFKGFTGRGECTLCLECIEACPYDAIKWRFGI